MYYLAREYFSRGKYREALEYYRKYLPLSMFAPELADAHLMIFRCCVALEDMDGAWKAAFDALRINANLAEALRMLAALSGPRNSAAWTRYAEIATNEHALFVRGDPVEIVEEKGAEHYQKIYGAGYDTSRYKAVYDAAAMLCKGKVLDVGCGLGDMAAYFEPDDYHGIDFAGAAEGGQFEATNIYDYLFRGYDTYLILEVLEHLDDLAVLAKIPADANVVFSVPSFLCEGHIRNYPAIASVTGRFADLLDIGGYLRFKMDKGCCMPYQGDDYDIILCQAVKK